MSLAGNEKDVASSLQVGENDRVWFPRWIRRYALNFHKGLVADLSVNEHSVIRFSKGLLRDNQGTQPTYWRLLGRPRGRSVWDSGSRTANWLTQFSLP